MNPLTSQINMHMKKADLQKEHQKLQKRCSIAEVRLEALIDFMQYLNYALCHPEDSKRLDVVSKNLHMAEEFAEKLNIAMGASGLNEPSNTSS